MKILRLKVINVMMPLEPRLRFDKVVKTPFYCIYLVLGAIVSLAFAIYTFVVGEVFFSGSQLSKHWFEKVVFETFGSYILGIIQLLIATFFIWLVIKSCKSDEEE